MTALDHDPAEWAPLPHLSVLDADAYEWLLSDHPWAVTERARRQVIHHARTLAEDDEGSTTTVRLITDPATGENLHQLAEMVDRIARGFALTANMDDAEDDQTRTARHRTQYGLIRRNAGDGDYKNPAHLTGPTAAHYPPPEATP